MSKATTSARRPHPLKPTPDFPLTPHPSGRWVKKRKGTTHYFGPLDKPAEALARFEREWPHILEGRTPPPPDAPDVFSVGALCNRFLASKSRKLRAGELTGRMLAVYHRVCAGIVTAFGARRAVDDLRPEDFAALREQLAERLGAAALKCEVSRIKGVMKYAFTNGYIPRPVPFGDEFAGPPKAALLKARHERGQYMFEAAELRRILDAVDPVWRAMLLLAVNAGLGQHDVACLTREMLTTACDSGWLLFPRPKNWQGRRCPLWGETIEAVRVALPLRPAAKDKADADLAFLSPTGKKLVRGTPKRGEDGEVDLSLGTTCVDGIGPRWRRLLAGLGIPQRGWYALRHTTVTIGKQARDDDAVRVIVGHDDRTMLERYTERVDDARLAAVCETVRTWLFAAPQEGGAA